MIEFVKRGVRTDVVFKFHPDIISAVKDVTGRRYDGSKKTWSIPTAKIDEAKLKLKKWIDNADIIKAAYELPLPTEHKLKDIEQKYQTVTTPYKHQIEMTTNALERNFYGFLCDMGTGKTKAAIDVILNRPESKRILVVCPRSVTFTWQNELITHGKTDSLIISGTRKKREKLIADKEQRIKIVNYGTLSPYLAELSAWNPDFIILDESQRIKNHKAQQSQAAHRLGRGTEWRMILTGTPVTNHLLDLWSQFYFLDGGRLLESSFFQFRGKWFTNIGKEHQMWVPRSSTVQRDLSVQIANASIRFSKEQCLDLPPKVFQEIEFDLSKEAAKAYKMMKKEFIAWVDGSDAPTIGSNMLTRLLRLSQITSGFVKTVEDVEKEFKHQDKMDVLLDLIEDLGDRKIIIWACYIHDIKAIEAQLSHKGIRSVSLWGDDKIDRRQVVEDFQNDPSVKVFIGQPASGGVGITLTAADVAIYYSQNFNWEYRAQSEDRCHRMGSEKHESITYYELLARCDGKKTIDHEILAALKRKSNQATFINNIVEAMRMEA